MGGGGVSISSQVSYSSPSFHIISVSGILEEILIWECRLSGDKVSCCGIAGASKTSTSATSFMTMENPPWFNRRHIDSNRCCFSIVMLVFGGCNGWKMIHCPFEGQKAYFQELCLCWL